MIMDKSDRVIVIENETAACVIASVSGGPATPDLVEKGAGVVAVVSDGSAMPGVVEKERGAVLSALREKAALFNELGGPGAFPIFLDTRSTDKIVETAKIISPGFSGICLEGISAPRCFEIERRLRKEAGLPVFHDNQHGTAIAVCAAAINAFKLSGKPLTETRVVVCGTGTVGNAIAKMLCILGVRDVVVCDSKGILSAKRIPEFGEDKLDLLEFTNREGISGDLEKAVKGRDVFIGASKPNVLTGALVRAMRRKPVIIALAGPEPEISPEDAQTSDARIVATASPDYPNRISSALVFPGIFKGALEAGAKDITDDMKAAAAYALADLVSEEELSEEHILPAQAGPEVTQAVANAVAGAWKEIELMEK